MSLQSEATKRQTPKGLATHGPTNRRVLHFSDGVFQEESSDEEESIKESEEKIVVDPKGLAWIPWIAFGLRMTGVRLLGYCDAAGEKLSWWFGITSPKYYYEIQEALRMKEEENQRQARQDAEMAGWDNKSTSSTNTVLTGKSLQSSKRSFYGIPEEENLP